MAIYGWEPLVCNGYTTLVDYFYNSADLAKLLKSQKTDCAGSVIKQNVPVKVKEEKL